MSLSELRDRVLVLPQVQGVELEGEEPSRLRIEVGNDDDVEHFVALCLMLGCVPHIRSKSRTLVVEDL